MASVPPLVEAVGLLTVVSGIQQVVFGALDERRKAAETRRAQRLQKSTTRAAAEAEAERETDREAKKRDRLIAENEALQQQIEKQAAEILRQRGEIAELYRSLYNADPRYHRPPGA
jgi:dynactin complex subunit